MDTQKFGSLTVNEYSIILATLEVANQRGTLMDKLFIQEYIDNMIYARTRCER